MRDIKFQEVGMENYGPYIDPMIHTFQPDKLTLLTGPNGIGKTMSLDAIPFTLFGITSKKAKGDDVVNNVVGKNCKTWVKFKVNSDQYIVTRYHKYKRVGNTVVINKNGVDTMKGHREVLPELEKLLCSQKAFMNTLMFGQKVKDFFTDLVDSDKKEIFRKILNLERYTLYYKQTDKKLKADQTNYDNLSNQIHINQGLLDDAYLQINILKSIKQKFYEQKEQGVKELQLSLEDNKRLLKEWELKLTEVQSQDIDIESTNKHLMDVENSIKNSTEKFQITFDQLEQQKQAKISEIQVSAAKAKMEVKNISAKDIESMTDQKAETVQKLNKTSTYFRQKMHEVDLETDNIKFEITSFLERKNEINSNVIEAKISICPTCEQDVTDEAREKLIEKISSYNKKISILSQKENKCSKQKIEFQNMLEEETSKYNRMIATIDNEIAICKREESEEYKKIQDRVEVAIKKVSELVKIEQKKIEQKSNEQTKELQETQQKLILEKSNKESLLEQLKKVSEIILSINQKINSLNDTINFKETQTYDETQFNSYIKKESELSETIKSDELEIDRIEENMRMLQFWKTGFSPTGIPSMLIDEAIPFMNRKVSKYLDMLTNGRYIVSFDTLDEIKSGEFRDKISVRVVDTHTKANSRVQLSGGQTRIVDIATILTLGDLQTAINDVSYNILLFDEIFDALDYDNVGYVCKVLNKLKVGKSIFVISHQHQDQLEPDELLTFN